MEVVWLIAILLGLALFAVIAGIGIYNSLVSLRQQTVNAWSQIDVQLKRRYDLIPNLVETVKGYMDHEKDTLERVIQARNQAIAAKGVKEQGQAESLLGAALGNLFALSEAYPDLKANDNMRELQEELRSTENKISFARQYYNDVTTRYNTKLEVIPSSIVANISKFESRELFEISEATEREPVKVEF